VTRVEYGQILDSIEKNNTCMSGQLTCFYCITFNVFLTALIGIEQKLNYSEEVGIFLTIVSWSGRSDILASLT
jgi:hypothetical protein